MSENPPGSPMLGYQTPQVPMLSKDRMVAGRIAIWIGALMLLGATCLGFALVALTFAAASLASSGSPPAGTRTMMMFAGVFGIVLTAFIVAMGTCYLVGGIYIRRGSRKWASVIFVLAICHEALVCLSLISGAISVLQDSRNLISLCVQLLFAAAIGQLIFCLNRARQEAV